MVIVDSIFYFVLFRLVYTLVVATFLLVQSSDESDYELPFLLSPGTMVFSRVESPASVPASALSGRNHLAGIEEQFFEEANTGNLAICSPSFSPFVPTFRGFFCFSKHAR